MSPAQTRLMTHQVRECGRPVFHLVVRAVISADHLVLTRDTAPGGPGGQCRRSPGTAWYAGLRTTGLGSWGDSRSSRSRNRISWSRKRRRSIRKTVILVSNSTTYLILLMLFVFRAYLALSILFGFSLQGCFLFNKLYKIALLLLSYIK